MQYSRNFYEIKSNEKIFAKIQAERETVGYYSLPYANVDDIIDFAETVKQSHIAIIGIGGSSLGTYTIHKFLKPKKTSKKKLHFFESTDPLDIAHRLSKLDLVDTLFLVVSKSGTTIETISIFKYFSSLVKIDSENCVVISEHDSPLSDFARVNKIRTFDIHKNVGGRFSVFSAVGLVPLALIGIDIKGLLKGCRAVNDSFFSQAEYYRLIFQKARFLIENKNRFNINIVFSYSASLEAFNKWYVQLWGESLGKINIKGTKQGLTPIGLIGPVDQHSFLQLINEGKRDKTITFIKVANLQNQIQIPSSGIDNYVNLDCLNNVRFQDLIAKQCDATIESVRELKDVPYDIITLDSVGAESIAKLMYFYQLLVSVVGAFLQINTYDQPGVERGKVILKEGLK